ncbi:MAG: hypothetical protein LUD79_02150, partial [Oscillospiraceae bacterium]|nr:hypothetical protein [Oscillospiraceae bacterium]
MALSSQCAYSTLFFGLLQLQTRINHGNQFLAGSPANYSVATAPDLVFISQWAFSTPFLFDGAKRN